MAKHILHVEYDDETGELKASWPKHIPTAIYMMWQVDKVIVQQQQQAQQDTPPERPSGLVLARPVPTGPIRVQ